MTQRQLFNIQAAHASWHTCLKHALKKMDPLYLESLYTNPTWLPGQRHIFNAFSLPVEKTRYILFGESPYPRAASANGYAFWDAAVQSLWSATGLSKPVNRATSLRNIIKMLLIAEGKLKPHHTSQAEIAALNKEDLIKTNHELFHHLLQHGFLLLNATPVLQLDQVKNDARAWRPFIHYVLDFLCKKNSQVQLILLGNLAKAIDSLTDTLEIKRIYAEHPYNISFIHNEKMIEFFRPLHLLRND